VKFAMTERRFLSSPWWVVFGSAMALIVGNAPITLYSFGLFFKPLSNEFGWDRGTISAASSVAGLLSALCIPLIGFLMDRWGIRRILISSVIAYAFSIALVSVTPPSATVFILLYALVGLAGAGQGPLGYVKAVSSWFDEARGLAIGITMAGIGIGAVIVPQYTQLVINILGWRFAYVGLGFLLLVIALPNVVLFVRSPSVTGALPGQSGDFSPQHALPGLTLRGALAGKTFWLIGLAVSLVATVTTGTIVHIVPLLTDKGLSATVAASMLIASGLATLAGRLVSGYLFDRFFAPNVAALIFLLPCGGLYLLGTGKGSLIGIVLLGLCLGSEMDLIGYLTSRYFGLKHFGIIYGVMFAIFSAGAALGPITMGAGFDRLHSYAPVLSVFAGMLILASIVMLSLGSYAYPVARRPTPIVVIPAASGRGRLE
jgi:MFS family permease